MRKPKFKIGDKVRYMLPEVNKYNCYGDVKREIKVLSEYVGNIGIVREVSDKTGHGNGIDYALDYVDELPKSAWYSEECLKLYKEDERESFYTVVLENPEISKAFDDMFKNLETHFADVAGVVLKKNLVEELDRILELGDANAIIEELKAYRVKIEN